MHVLALADRRPDIDFAAVCSDQAVDAVFLLGDLDFYDLPGLAEVALPKAGVYGNHCRGDYLPRVGAVNCHIKRFRLGDTVVGGLEGCPRYKGTGDYQYHPDDVAMMLRMLQPVDILLTHCPPRGINDHSYDVAHAGWEALVPWVQTNQPRHLLHGHTYPKDQDLVTQMGATQVHYVHGWAVLDLD